MGNRNRFLRKTLCLTLALSIPLSGLLAQTGIGGTAAAETNASEAMLRSLFGGLTTESITSQAASPESNDDPIVRQNIGIFAADAGGVVNAVYAAEKPLAPVLDPLPAYSNLSSIAVTGSAAAGAAVTVSYAWNGGADTAAGTVTADASAAFWFDLPLMEEGEYRITAIASQNGTSSDRSGPAVVLADRTPPQRVENAGWKLLYPSNTTVLLQWMPPLVPDGQGGMKPDPSIARYTVSDTSDTQLRETAGLEAIMEGLEPARMYPYRVRAVDQAGNVSDYETIYAGTSPAGEVKLTDFASEVPVPPAMSGDGGTILYTDDENRLYRVDTTTGDHMEVVLTRDGEAPDGAIRELAVNRAGNRFAFSSDAANLRIAQDPSGAPNAVYVYDADTEQIGLVSTPGQRAGKPALSGSGQLLAFVENGQIYVSDRAGNSVRLVSEAEGGGAGNGISDFPAISADGRRIVYETTSTNLKGAAISGSGSNAIAVYDVASDRHVWVAGGVGSSRNPAISADGALVVYRGSFGGFPKLHMLDMRDPDSANWTNEAFPDNRSTNQRKDKSYSRVAISGDGSYAVATLHDYNPQGSPYANSYAERFNRQTGAVDTVGNPASNTPFALIDETGNRIVYVRDGGLYTYCYGVCVQPEPSDDIESVNWSTASSDQTFGSVNPGAVVTIQAIGKPGGDIVAEVAYRETIEGDPARERAAKKTLAMTETPGGSGLYRATFSVAEGMTQIDSIAARPAGGGDSRYAPQTPIHVAGKLLVTIEAPYPAVLGTLQLALQSSEGLSTKRPLAAGQTRYELMWPADPGVTLEIRDANGAEVYARQSGVTVHRGAATPVALAPVIPATLSVEVLHGFHPVVAQLTFKDESGATIGSMTTDSMGKAVLSGRQAGETVTVSVAPPNEYVVPADRKVTLRIGNESLQVPLEKWSDTVGSYKIEFAREVGREPFKLPVIGSEVRVTARAKSGIALRAKIVKEVWDGGESTVPADEWIGLAESPDDPGGYTGSFAIAEGTASLKELTFEANGVLFAETYPVRKHVASRLQVQLDVLPDSEWSAKVAGAALDMSSSGGSTLFYYSERKTVGDGTEVYTFDTPYPLSAHSLILRPAGLKSVQLTVASPASGLTSNVSLAPEFNFAFRWNMKQDGVPAMWYKGTLRNVSDGSIVWQSSGYDLLPATVQLPRRSASAERLQLTIVPSDPSYEVQTVEATANSAVTAMNVPIVKKPEALLSGRVFGTGGAPSSGSTVTATVKRDNTSKTFRAVTDKSGAYSLTVPAGEVELKATSSAGAGRLSRTLKLEAIGEQTVDLTLHDYAKVTFRLYTKLLGGDWSGPIELDWRTSVHFHVKPSFQVMSQQGNEYRAEAVIGDTIGICVNGFEAGLPGKCQETVIDENNEAAIEIRLENSGGQAAFRAIRPDGSTPTSVSAVLYQPDGSHSNYSNLLIHKEKQQFVIPIGSAGNHRLQLRAANGDAAMVDFAARPGDIVELGNIALQRPIRFFGAGNGLESASDWATPNGRITLRAFYLDGGSSGQAEVRDAILSLQLPKETEYVPGTLVVNGTAAQPSAVGQTLEIPIGSVKRAETGAVQLQLKLREQPSLSQVAIAGKIRYSDSVPREEAIGTTVIDIVPVTIRAPETVAAPHFKVSGYAPAGAQVTVYDNGVVMGVASVSPEGTWSLPVELADTLTRKHRLTTEAEVAGVRTYGERAFVEYDPNDPGLSSVVMRQPDGRVYQFDPGEGVAVFPYVVAPSYPFLFELSFRDISRVYDVYVTVGDSVAPAQLVDGRYQASVPVTYNLGPVGVEYRTKRAADEGPGPVPDEEQFRRSLPSDVAGYSVDWIAGPGERTPDGTVMPAGAASVKLQFNSSLKGQMSVLTEPAGAYEPSERDRQVAERTGVPVYGFNLSLSKNESSMTVKLTGYVPDGSASPATARGGGPVAALAVKEELVKKTVRFTIDRVGQALGFRDIIAGAMDAADPDNFARRINRAIEVAENLCDLQAREYYTNFAWNVKLDIHMHERVKTTVGVLGTYLGKGLGGIAFWGEGYYIGMKLDEVINDELTELEDHLNKYNSELKCSKKKPKKPVADPKYIWDPSGYVYEGIPGNRVQDVTATVMEKEPATGVWNVWDSEWYGQSNPLLTDGQGRYAWDVPPGKWMVKYEKEGYETTYSDELDVPPPQLEVNIPMMSFDEPQVDAVYAAAGGTHVDIRFSKPIDAGSIGPDSLIVTAENGTAVAGEAKAKEPVEANGKTLTEAVRFVPAGPMPDGAYRMNVSGTLASYAGVTMGRDAELSFRVARRDVTPPADVAGLTAGVASGTAIVAWDEPKDADYAAARVRWKMRGAPAFGEPIEAAKGTGWAQITGLPDADGYEFRVTAVDESGNESAGVTALWTRGEDWTPPLAAADLEALTVREDRIELRWTDPASSDLAKLRLSWAREASPDDVRSGETTPRTGAYTISGLTPDTPYIVSVVAVDTAGNESLAASIQVRTNAASTGGGDPSPGGGSGGHPGGPAGGGTGSGTAADPHAAEATTGPAGGIYRAFEGKLELTVAPGTFPADTKLSLGLKEGTDAKLPGGYARMSHTVTIASDGAVPAKPMKLSLRFDPAAARTIDVRKLGLYKKADAHPAGWTYLGGIAGPDSGTVEADVAGYGEYAVLLYDRTFSDLIAHWARSDAEVLVSRHLVDGAGADRFEPDRPITRAEATKLLVESLRQGMAAERNGQTEAKANTVFADVGPDAWYAPYVAAAVRLGLAEGADNRFRPDDAVTREELAVLLRRFAGLYDGGALPVPRGEESAVLERFADVRDISGWAREAVADSVSQGWLQGVTATELMPQGEANRAQAAVMLLRVLASLGAITK